MAVHCGGFEKQTGEYSSQTAAILIKKNPYQMCFQMCLLGCFWIPATTKKQNQRKKNATFHSFTASSSPAGRCGSGKFNSNWRAIALCELKILISVHAWVTLIHLALASHWLLQQWKQAVEILPCFHFAMFHFVLCCVVVAADFFILLSISAFCNK